MEEPDAVTPHVRICEGEIQQWMNYSTRQAGEVRGRWRWTEPSVWTERMLAALEQGVRGGKNTFFAERGLFATTTAYRLVSQPPSG